MPSSKVGMEYQENHQKRVLGVIIAVSSKNKLFLGVWSPPQKHGFSSFGPYVAAFGPNPGGDVGPDVCVCIIRVTRHLVYL